MLFDLHAPFTPSGDQPAAIAVLVDALRCETKASTLLGVTGSGKTFTISNVIAEVQRPTLVISHNKTLAAQLASEFREFFPNNAVHYFVSYYDYYQPEAYIPRTDTYIEKETQINEEIDRLRHASTQALLTRRDVIIVASVSCIYGLGSPQEYLRGSLRVEKHGNCSRRELLIKLVSMNFQRNDIDFFRGTFRVRGDVVEVFPTANDVTALRFDFFGDDLENITEVDVLTGETRQQHDAVTIFPATLYQSQTEHFENALVSMRKDLEQEVRALQAHGKEFEAHRLEQRVKFDLEMIKNTGYTNGIENYSRYFDGRAPGTPPYTLLDYFPKDFLTVIDESHQTIPQIGGMYAGDRSRKELLVSYGFRMNAAFDNRPLRFEEFEQRIKQSIFVSATPGPYEKQHTLIVAEQLIRPTGICEPTIDIHPINGQIPHLLSEIQKRIDNGQRVLVTTLTKRMAEKLAEYINENGIRVQYLHSGVDTMERLEILRDLRTGKYDVLVGINLLREGLDLPEVSLVTILDADKEGFLRSETALIQTMGRAARHIDGHVILYADRVTGSMQRAIAEVDRRRVIQHAYNRAHNITPKQIVRALRDDRLSGAKVAEESAMDVQRLASTLHPEELAHLLHSLQQQMQLAAQNLEFEKAAALRDQITMIEETMDVARITKSRSLRRYKKR